VYGIALVYGVAGTTNIRGIGEAIVGGELDPRALFAAAGLIAVGFGFKIAAVPFHMWTPDVYQGAPTPVTAFMSVGAKVGGFAALLRVFLTAFPAIGWTWWPAVAVIAMATMIVGNVLALVQTDLKRLLGYSSIAHAGYILMAVAAAGANPANAEPALAAALFYLLAYAFTNLGAFAVAIAVELDAPGSAPGAPAEAASGTRVRDLAGLGKTHVGLALAMSLFMLSLTGVPPTGGFTGKFALFSAAIGAAAAAPGTAVEGWMIALTLVGVLTSVISAFYYLGVVVTMFMREGEGFATARGALALAVALTVLGTLWLGLLPGTVLAQMHDLFMAGLAG
jgi:NADH-quinone oxidoreductase subunit N